MLFGENKLSPNVNLSHATSIPSKQGSKEGEYAGQRSVLEGSHTLNLQRTARRIPPGTITGAIPLEAAKAFPTRIFQGLNVEPLIAYADISKKEVNQLFVKLIPEGAVTAPHPQIVLYVKGDYHPEPPRYPNTDIFKWTTWWECHFHIRYALPLASALLKAHMQQENGGKKQ